MVAIACNCGNKNKSFNYIYTDGSGVQHTYGSQIEAEAAKIRAGGVGSIRAVQR